MKHRLAAAVTTLLMAFTLLVALAPASDAAYCRTLRRSDAVEIDVGVNTTVYINLYICDFGSYERVETAQLTWPNGTNFIRKAYDNGPDVNLQKRCDNNATWYTMTSRTNYYNSTVYTIDSNCTEPADFRIDLTADVVWFYDNSIRAQWDNL